MEKGYTTKLDKEDQGIAFYTILWSPFLLMDRLLIHRIIPSEGGIFQVYQKDNRRLELIMVDRAYYGGLRNRIRELIDPLYMGRNPYRQEIQEGECYVRYTLVSLQDDMDDLIHYFTGRTATGRYDDIRVDEREVFQIRKDF